MHDCLRGDNVAGGVAVAGDVGKIRNDSRHSLDKGKVCNIA